MPFSITRRDFLRRLVAGTTMSLGLLPGYRSEQYYAQPAVSTETNRNLQHDAGNAIESVDGGSPSDADGAIPTRFFYPGYTKSDLERDFALGNLVNGFPWGVADIHTLGGIAVRDNISVGIDGSAVLTLHRPTPQELADWDVDGGIQTLIRAGEQNGLVMKLSAAVICGRIPSDVRSMEVSVALPASIVSGDTSRGMSGIGWAFWTIVDVERLTRELGKLGLEAKEIGSISDRVNAWALEEDIAEMSFGEPTVELGYPLWVRLLSNQVLTFIAGRKTMTAKSPKIDLIHTLFEPIGVGPLPIVNDRTVSGWLATEGVAQSQVLRRPLRARLDIGSPVYDGTRDVMAAPMTFSLNGKKLIPTKTREFPGLEADPNGNAPANLSIWQIKTSKGQWVTIPRRFILNINSSTGHKVVGERDSIGFSDLVISRGR